MMTNAQAALIAAASVPPNPSMVSISSTADNIVSRAEQFKQWLDYQDSKVSIHADQD